MAQSLTQLYVHLVFSTKHRAPLITEEIKDDLWSYMGGICNNLDCPVVRIGGYTDHVHIACGLSKKITLIKLLEEVKKSSSRWIKEKYTRCNNFYWQNGYAAFSISPQHLGSIVHYIDQQPMHHAKLSYQDECRSFFKKYNVAYDERYVWD